MTHVGYSRFSNLYCPLASSGHVIAMACLLPCQAHTIFAPYFYMRNILPDRCLHLTQNVNSSAFDIEIKSRKIGQRLLGIPQEIESSKFFKIIVVAADDGVNYYNLTCLDFL